MRKKELRLVVAFHTTAAAMSAEKICNSKGLEGRLISVPRSITYCGIAWSAPPELREQLEALFNEAGLEVSGFYLL